MRHYLQVQYCPSNLTHGNEDGTEGEETRNYEKGGRIMKAGKWRKYISMVERVRLNKGY
jgi:hypothetical protein